MSSYLAASDLQRIIAQLYETVELTGRVHDWLESVDRTRLRYGKFPGDPGGKDSFPDILWAVGFGGSALEAAIEALDLINYKNAGFLAAQTSRLRGVDSKFKRPRGRQRGLTKLIAMPSFSLRVVKGGI